MADLGWFIFSTGGAVVCLGVSALWVLVSRGSTASRRVLAVVALLYWVASVDAVPSAVRQLLSAGYAPLTRDDVPAGHTAVVLLGSGSNRYRDWDNNQLTIVDPIGTSRLLEAARVFRLVEADYLISSGGLNVVRDRNQPSGSAMAEALVQRGVPRTRIRVEDDSRTTRDEAVIVSRMLAAHPVDHVILVTSQFHMRRSVGAFRAVGIEVIPAVAREARVADGWWENALPSDKGISDTGMAAHELAGLLAYAARGWYR